MAPDGADGSCPERQEEGNDNTAGAGKGWLEDYMEGLGEEDSSAGQFQGKLLVSDEVENCYLQSGAAAVSIMQLPLWFEDKVVCEGVDLGEIDLVGRSVSESRDIRVLVEKWMLDLRPNSTPTFLVKAACGWIRAQKPKIVYRRILSDALTVAHFFTSSQIILPLLTKGSSAKWHSALLPDLPQTGPHDVLLKHVEGGLLLWTANHFALVNMMFSAASGSYFLRKKFLRLLFLLWRQPRQQSIWGRQHQCREAILGIIVPFNQAVHVEKGRSETQQRNLRQIAHCFLALMQLNVPRSVHQVCASTK